MFLVMCACLKDSGATAIEAMTLFGRKLSFGPNGTG